MPVFFIFVEERSLCYSVKRWNVEVVPSALNEERALSLQSGLTGEGSDT